MSIAVSLFNLLAQQAAAVANAGFASTAQELLLLAADTTSVYDTTSDYGTTKPPAFNFAPPAQTHMYNRKCLSFNLQLAATTSDCDAQNTSLYNCDHVIPAFPASRKPDMCKGKLHSQPHETFCNLCHQTTGCQNSHAIHSCKQPLLIISDKQSMQDPSKPHGYAATRTQAVHPSMYTQKHAWYGPISCCSLVRGALLAAPLSSYSFNLQLCTLHKVAGHTSSTHYTLCKRLCNTITPA
jgi:hypothetical protein